VFEFVERKLNALGRWIYMSVCKVSVCGVLMSIFACGAFPLFCFGIMRVGKCDLCLSQLLLFPQLQSLLGEPGSRGIKKF
jgi:hypothetical protein